MPMEPFTCKYGLNDGTLRIGDTTLQFHDDSKDETECRVCISVKDISKVSIVESDGIHVVSSGEDHLFLHFKECDKALGALQQLGVNVEASSPQETDTKNVVESSTPLRDSVLFFASAQKNRDSNALKKSWLQLKTKPDSLFELNPIESLVLPCTLEAFHEMFWSTNATHPTSKYMRDKVNDTDINVSAWTHSDDKFTLTRSIKYLHPNHSPMGPPKANTTKDQQLQKYGDYGMMLHTVTTVDDVPMTDCFVIEDQILVEPKDSSSIVLSARCGIRFVKKTMWKKIIKGNAKKGITGWLEGYGRFVSEAIPVKK